MRFNAGQFLTLTVAKGTPYEKPPVTVKYVSPYFHAVVPGEEHVVSLPDGSKLAVLDRDLDTW